MNKKKIIILSVIVVSLVILLASGTYAWYVWSNASEDDVQVLAGLDAATVVYTGGSNITGVRLKPTETKEEGIVKSIKIYSKEEVYYTLNFDLYLDILSLPEGLKDTSFKYSFYKGDTLIKGGSFTQEYLDSNLVTCTTNSTNHIVLLTDEEITSSVSEYILYIWIDGNLPNPDTMQNLDFSFKLHATGENAVVEEPTLVSTISDLYNDAEKTTITNNSIVYNRTAIYDNDDDNTTSGGLMNDRLGGTITDYDAGNIRYYGASPNNYIDIGDTEINSEGNEVPTLYRIIGVFKDVELEDGTTKDLVKVIRNDDIESYSWDTSASTINSGYGINEWSQADLMKLLNPGYNSETVGGSLYWNSESGTCYSGRTNATTPCDFKTKKEGLSTEAQEKIVSVVWNLGGHSSSSVFSNEIYKFERQGNVLQNQSDGITRKTEWPGKVGLMYPSDYGYATDLSSSVCSSNLYNYDTSTNSYGCRSNDWLYNSSFSQWTLSPSSSYAFSVFTVYSSGSLSSYYAYRTIGVRPVFYLDSELTIESGDGSSSNPYRLS